MHEHAVAAVAHEKGDRLVHVGGLRTVRIVGPHYYLLAAFVEGCERLPTPEQPLVRREREGGREQPAQVGGGAYERERDGQRVDHALRVGQVPGPSQELARRVPKLETP